jgi:hypothetical protein
MGGFRNDPVREIRKQSRQMRQQLTRQGLQVIERMEREMGLEPTTSSLGISDSIDYRDVWC